ncbi:MAG: DNA-processing protein DprA [Pseudomonadota bacterium]
MNRLIDFRAGQPAGVPTAGAGGAAAEEAFGLPLARRIPPARDDADRLARLRLARSENVGPRSFLHLIARFGDAAAALASLPAMAQRGGRDGYAACPAATAEDEHARGIAAGARLVTLGDDDYPERLLSIASPPPVLWVAGNNDCVAGSAVAVVGARNASALGIRLARRMARGLAEAGECVVSGLARGIDTAAHEGALDARHDGISPVAPGRTVAVLPGGIDIAYPAENGILAARIVAEGGLLVAECAPGTEPTARHFPRRNRLVSGLADGVVLVEAASRSGSLITARTALEQGREVMACPGSAEDPRAGGCNALIRDGAALVRNPRDVLDALSTVRLRGFAEEPDPFVPAGAGIGMGRALPGSLPGSLPGALDGDGPTGVEADDDALPARVLALLSHAPVESDDLARAAGVTPCTLAQALVDLELAGRIEMVAGGRVQALVDSTGDPH